VRDILKAKKLIVTQGAKERIEELYGNAGSSWTSRNRAGSPSMSAEPLLRAPSKSRAGTATMKVFDWKTRGQEQTPLADLDLSNLQVAPGSHKSKTRKGRGISAGQGQSCGFGNRGQKSRSGRPSRPGLEGGQTPLYRRLPKFVGRPMGPGHSKTLYGIVTTDSLNGLDDCATVDYATLQAQGRVHKSKYDLTKVLVGDEPFTAQSITVMAHAFSDAARAAIEKNGGTCVVLPKTAKADDVQTAENYQGSRAGSPEMMELTEDNVEIVDDVEGADTVEEVVESDDEAGSRAGSPSMSAAADTASLLTALRRAKQVGRTEPPVMSAAVDEVMEKLKSMTLLEASELVKAIEETFDVDASVGGGMMMAPMAGGAVAGGDAPAAEEKTEFDLVLDSFPADKKIAVLKIVRELTGLGLKDAKEMVEKAPCTVKEGASKAECDEAKAKLEEAGAKVDLK